MGGASKTTLKLGDLLERSEAKGRGTWGRVQRKAGTSFQESPPPPYPRELTQDTPVLSATGYDHVCQAVSIREAHWRLGVQGYY